MSKLKVAENRCLASGNLILGFLLILAPGASAQLCMGGALNLDDLSQQIVPHRG